MNTRDDGREPAPPEDSHSVGYYVVALVDVLGQSRALARWARMPDGNVNREFVGALKKSVGTVIAIRDSLEKYIGEFRARTPQPREWNELSEEQQRGYLKLTSSEIRSQSFADTCVLFSPIRQHAGEPVVKDVFGVLAGMAMLVPGFLSGYVPLRGAVEIGTGTDAFPGQIYGPCLASAHYLEAKIADYPRVVVGPNLFSFLKQAVERDRSTQYGAFTAEMAKETMRLVAIDKDGYPIVDHLGQFMAEQDRAMGSRLRPLVQKATGFVASELERFRREGDTKLFSRYEKLRNYFDSRLRFWS